MSSDGQFQERIERVRQKADLAAIMGAAGVKLSRGRNPRGQCPFHGSKSDSLAVYPERGRAHCWGCGWDGDAIRFVQDHYGLTFGEALRRVEEGSGGSGLDANPVRRVKSVPPRRQREVAYVEPIAFGRWLWKHARPNAEAARTYFMGRGVPATVLDDGRFANIRFLSLAPIAAWRTDKGPGSVPQSPALVSLVRRAPDGINPPWQPMGVHVTFLSPDLRSKMDRQRHDGTDYPARKMLGSMAGGCVLLPGASSSAGNLDPFCPIFPGEGIETVLAGMALNGTVGGSRDTGLAALSLDTLQGHERLIRGARPLFDPTPDFERGAGLAFAHQGPVTVLVDADMKPLRGPIDQCTGEPRGEMVIEVRRGPIVRRAITGAERAAICGTLSVKSWRAVGVEARAVRPRMGQDFNDAVREVSCD